MNSLEETRMLIDNLYKCPFAKKIKYIERIHEDKYENNDR